MPDGRRLSSRLAPSTRLRGDELAEGPSHLNGRKACWASVYRDWQLSETSLSGAGGAAKPYRHYCPIEDFRFLAQAAIDVAARTGEFTRKELIEAAAAVGKMPSGRAYNEDRHDYKISLASQYLVDSGIAKRLKGRYGHYIHYALARTPAQARAWLAKL